ncbi:MAG: DeoR/GlpR family DNA-binding transcription regulator [Deltaproteobacteria bacterium]|nr:DeoR/GlpR family DNA-binding transcription regulator [Deltaproteobacteria bacterium]
MLAEQRQEFILSTVNRLRSITVTELSEELKASETTIRRDIATLSARGLVNKVHGGATARALEFVATDVSVNDKLQLYAEEKMSIGLAAANLIEPNDFVFLDAGTTTLRLAEYLEPNGASFVTSGVAHASLMIKKGLRVYILGGMLKAGTEAIVGVAALSSLEQYNFTKAFMGCNGIRTKEGLTTPDMEEAAVKAKAVERAMTTYVLADHSKFGKVSADSFSTLAQATIITDHCPDQLYRSLTNILEVSK